MNSTADDGGGSGSDSKAQTYSFAHKTIIIPHDSKISRGGEDAASTIDDMLVVSDGVGGWAKVGVDPGLYSRELVEIITLTYAALTASERAAVDLKRLLAWSNRAAARAHVGTATCTVVRLENATTLEAVSVGDSGYSIHRRGAGGRLEVAHASVPRQKGFNHPYQLGGRYGDGVYQPNVTDGPNLHALEAGDVVVLFTDGVSDNMDPDDYHDCIGRYQWGNVPGGRAKAAFRRARGGRRPAAAEIVSRAAVADCIARTAYLLGKSATHDGPFARKAAEYGRAWSGGKEDDIAVVVAQVEVADADGTLAPGGDPYLPAATYLCTGRQTSPSGGPAPSPPRRRSCGRRCEAGRRS